MLTIGKNVAGSAFSHKVASDGHGLTKDIALLQIPTV